MNPLTDARNAVTDLLRGNGFNVYPAPPEVLTHPAIVVSAGDPWAEPVTWSRTRVGLVVSVAATQAGSNDSAYASVEQGAWLVLALLRDIGQPGPLSVPHQITVGQSEVLMVDIAVTVQVDDESEA